MGAVLVEASGRAISSNNMLHNSGHTEHAERRLLTLPGNNTEGSTLYVTLIPCAPLRRKSMVKSCSELIVERGVARVVFGYLPVLEGDHGDGMNYLRRAGVEVTYFRQLRDRISQLMNAAERRKFYGLQGKEEGSILTCDCIRANGIITVAHTYTISHEELRRRIPFHATKESDIEALLRRHGY